MTHTEGDEVIEQSDHISLTTPRNGQNESTAEKTDAEWLSMKMNLQILLMSERNEFPSDATATKWVTQYGSAFGDFFSIMKEHQEDRNKLLAWATAYSHSLESGIPMDEATYQDIITTWNVFLADNANVIFKKAA